MQLGQKGLTALVSIVRIKSMVIEIAKSVINARKTPDHNHTMDRASLILDIFYKEWTILASFFFIFVFSTVTSK